MQSNGTNMMNADQIKAQKALLRLQSRLLRTSDKADKLRSQLMATEQKKAALAKKVAEAQEKLNRLMQ